MRKELKAYIEVELKNYHQSKRDLEEIRESIIEGFSSEDNMGIRGSRTSYATGSKAMKLITNKRMKKLEETIAVIDNVIGELDEEKYKLIELKYWTRPSKLTDEGIASELSVGRATFYRWKDGILLAIASEMCLVHNI
ncbi:hypothetical protein RH915_05915 [Serpentinicella sp. ANB-PHB4]|uniref:hypothetical protein n=1 Tax=Serpentinicella sp. ANB-PHB4 TaxID=3074076 RepID=UPI002857F72A|nr:hypothetical protein [Serpentinicella sp. ANB-PHB4]MDR5659019.1 hypothetical protein [Serpentinicella sp. ANB-PHB4]